MDAIIQALNTQFISTLGPQMGVTAWFFAKSLTMILMVMIPEIGRAHV